MADDRLPLDRLGDVADEMAARAQDPRCPEPWAQTLLGYQRRIAAELRALTREPWVCSWCGKDYEPGGGSSTDCCNCDPVPASALPGLLASARAEAEKELDEHARAEDVLDAARRVAGEQRDPAGEYAGLHTKPDSVVEALALQELARLQGAVLGEPTAALADTTDAEYPHPS